MIKITIVAPYADFVDLAEKTFREHNEYPHKLEYELNQYELEVILAYGADEVRCLKLDSDVVVARGVTAYELRNRDYYIPVVEIPVAGNDLIRCLHESKTRFGTKPVAVIGSRNMIYGVESLSDIVGLDIKPFVMSNREEVKRLVNAAVNQGIQVIIGGIPTCEYAIKLGLDTILIKTGKESIWQAITEAKRVAYISRIEQEKALRFKTILDYAYEGIIAVDNKNTISVFNSSSEKTLGINAQKAIGKKFEEIIPKSKLTDLVNTKDECIDEIIKHNDIQLAVNKVPIVLKGENLGTVLTFQNVTKIQEMEGKIREKIYTRGHVAKHTFEDIIGESKKIKDVIKMAKRFSQVDSNILIVGETGTGKELFAQSIHNYSPRKRGPFVAVNCAALPENLLESELFGYVEGAFTGAAKGGKPGLFELAHRGTIFLDEISEISLKLQGRLLRVIQEKEIMRLGHDRVIPVDVRIISATNKDLYTLAQKGDFREDLYYRLDILKINLPPLRDRREDILIIVEYFIKNYCLQFRKGDITITQKAKERLQDYDWSGNIRELRNICERLVVLNQGNIISEKDVEAVLPDRCNIRTPFNDEEAIDSINIKYNYTEELKKFERERIKAVLERVGYNKIKAAESLGISRTTLWRRMKELDII
jgi:PAS domain S-box-containing protein